MQDLDLHNPYSAPAVTSCAKLDFENWDPALRGLWFLAAGWTCGLFRQCASIYSSMQIQQTQRIPDAAMTATAILGALEMIMVLVATVGFLWIPQHLKTGRVAQVTVWLVVLSIGTEVLLSVMLRTGIPLHFQNLAIAVGALQLAKQFALLWLLETWRTDVASA